MAELMNVIYDIERCICHVPDACRDCSHYPDKNGGPIGCMEDLLSEALELLKSMQGVPTWIRAAEPPKDDCECLVLTDDGLKFAEWRDGEWGTWQADFINGGFVDDKWEKLPWTVKFWMYDIVVSNEETED